MEAEAPAAAHRDAAFSQNDKAAAVATKSPAAPSREIAKSTMALKVEEAPRDERGRQTSADAEAPKKSPAPALELALPADDPASARAALLAQVSKLGGRLIEEEALLLAKGSSPAGALVRVEIGEENLAALREYVDRAGAPAPGVVGVVGVAKARAGLDARSADVFLEEPRAGVAAGGAGKPAAAPEKYKEKIQAADAAPSAPSVAAASAPAGPAEKRRRVVVAIRILPSKGAEAGAGTGGGKIQLTPPAHPVE